MKVIQLTQGYSALIDDADFERVSAHRWVAQVEPRGYVYAVSWMKPNPNAAKRLVKMHRFILGLVGSEPFVDHADWNGLNNQRSNIRPCDRRQNRGNSRTTKDTITGIKGVAWHPHANKFSARIQPTVNGNRKYVHLGYFDSKESAQKAYLDAAKKYYGEFARGTAA